MLIWCICCMCIMCVSGCKNKDDIHAVGDIYWRFLFILFAACSCFVIVFYFPVSSSGQRALVGAGRCEAGRFRGGGTADRHPDQEEHICWHTFLDGSGGHQTVSVWFQGEPMDMWRSILPRYCGFFLHFCIKTFLTSVIKIESMKW